MMRLAKPDDIPFVQKVLDAPDNLDKLAAYTDAQLAAALGDATQPLWIWESGGTPAAFLWVTGIGNLGRGPKIEEFGAETPGRGFGTRLFSAALSELRAQRLHKGLWLAVAADNAQAIRFYERLGFRATDLRPAVWRRRAGPVADALIMTFDACDGPRDREADASIGHEGHDNASG
jgi:GNAT superfamily N-acetyltransferase